MSSFLSFTVCIVTGAPGSGKSTALEAFLGLQADYLAFDSDWLIANASGLVGKTIENHPETWNNYNALWFDVLYAVLRNNRIPVIFAPWDTTDLEKMQLPTWCNDVKFLLLDCSDQTRIARLKQRQWNTAQIRAALFDAHQLRTQITDQLDTGKASPLEIARAIYKWLERVKTLQSSHL